ncbi:MAG: 16S rRNA (uracil(1498)-N(3))-methyltransferase [Firmicutes bacterium]|nr:16S rRNA (uracil(1498)-N(3))-methyltransferase [Bacillota bacterium]
MARLFVDPEMIEDGIVNITDAGDVHHITRVLRLREGDTVDVSDKTEYEYECKIILSAADIVRAEIVEKKKFSREPSIKVTLFQGIPKSGKMESIVQKCVELGIYEIVPLWTERTVVTDKGNFGKKIDRWQKIADEAVKQCRRGIIPHIEEDVKLTELCSHKPGSLCLTDYDLVLLAYEGEENLSIKDCLSGLSENPVDIAIIIGPEGGFSDAEVRMLTNEGAHSVTLGKTILRTETAGPAMLAMIMYALEL